VIGSYTLHHGDLGLLKHEKIETTHIHSASIHTKFEIQTPSRKQKSYEKSKFQLHRGIIRRQLFLRILSSGTYAPEIGYFCINFIK
jgi:hypothetical protein